MTRLLVLLVALAPLAGCADDHHDAPHASDPTASPDEATGFGGPLEGDLLETAISEGGEMEIGVTSEVFFLRMTEKMRGEIRDEMDEEIPDEGLGGAIGRAMSGFVEEALASTVQIPLEDVEGLRYEDGRLRFDNEGMNVRIEEDDDEGIPMREADARRIIDAFESAR